MNQCYVLLFSFSFSLSFPILFPLLSSSPSIVILPVHVTADSSTFYLWYPMFSRHLANNTDESDRYPPKIERLFAADLPYLYKKPVGYAPEERATPHITPLAPWKQAIEDYKKEYPVSKPSELPSVAKKRRHKESLLRQTEEWDDTEAFAQNDFLKDPYRTVFVARLYYWFTEMDLSKTFSKYGAVDSVRVVRDKSGESRGYGFVVFERQADASSCVRELAPTGLAVDPAPQEKPRKILVDSERGRLYRNWKPRRLGGGLGGRHYSSPGMYARDASAAASGRRMNLSQNPYQELSETRNESDRYENRFKRPAPDRGNRPAKRPAPSYEYHSRSAPASGAVANSRAETTRSETARADSRTIKDRYAKYLTGRSDRSGLLSDRSIRSIRQRD